MNIVSILIFGFIGGIIRFVWTNGNSADVLFVNALGALILGVLYVLWQRAHVKPWLEIGLSAGFIGSFTTFSSLMIEIVQFYPNHWFYSMIWILASFGAIALCAVGMGFTNYFTMHFNSKDDAQNNEQSA
ncbi:FluC/FEX family fluoride channel [Alicyclobacillus fodiniaquatilis]|jgi:CrcB protein|uniref:Fluoride-specific ion channel n=1 Tax=Alicyclobacillus fodiniaquatilis TaxID=1661150 RepID=A0ABW4JN54_9BACL